MKRETELRSSLQIEKANEFPELIHSACIGSFSHSLSFSRLKCILGELCFLSKPSIMGVKLLSPGRALFTFNPLALAAAAGLEKLSDEKRISIPLIRPSGAN